jgi:hypothetical protein
LAAREAVHLELVAGEADAFVLPRPGFDYVVVFSGLYNMLLPRGRRERLLRAAHQHLVAGGKVLLTFLSDYVPPNVPPLPASGSHSRWTRINPQHELGDQWLLNEAVHIFPHPARLEAEASAAGFAIVEVFRDQRAYDQQTRQVKGYAVLERRG